MQTFFQANIRNGKTIILQAYTPPSRKKKKQKPKQTKQNKKQAK